MVNCQIDLDNFTGRFRAIVGKLSTVIDLIPAAFFKE